MSPAASSATKGLLYCPDAKNDKRQDTKYMDSHSHQADTTIYIGLAVLGLIAVTNPGTRSTTTIKKLSKEEVTVAPKHDPDSHKRDRTTNRRLRKEDKPAMTLAQWALVALTGGA